MTCRARTQAGLLAVDQKTCAGHVAPSFRSSTLRCRATLPTRAAIFGSRSTRGRCAHEHGAAASFLEEERSGPAVLVLSLTGATLHGATAELASKTECILIQRNHVHPLRGLLSPSLAAHSSFSCNVLSIPWQYSCPVRRAAKSFPVSLWAANPYGEIRSGGPQCGPTLPQICPVNFTGQIPDVNTVGEDWSEALVNWFNLASMAASGACD